MSEYYDGDPEEDRAKSLSAQLKKYLEETPREQLERDFFEIECKCEGIDPDDEHAKFKLNLLKVGRFLHKGLHYFFDWLWRTIILLVAVLGGVILVKPEYSQHPYFWFIVCFTTAYALLTLYRAKCKNWFYLINDW
jgi:hypothetical protein